MAVYTNDYINYISLSVFDDCFKMFVDDKSKKIMNSLNKSNCLGSTPSYIIRKNVYIQQIHKYILFNNNIIV